MEEGLQRKITQTSIGKDGKAKGKEDNSVSPNKTPSKSM